MLPAENAPPGASEPASELSPDLLRRIEASTLNPTNVQVSGSLATISLVMRAFRAWQSEQETQREYLNEQL
ncbi:hypothetical protein F3R65_20830 [Salmonella enterica subsp. enterica]|nr:hypothetical protein [Salmonella enterica]EBV2388736.1 hypothetical protein [Salmonella enterica subsp. enterica serovar Mississippi]EBW7776977.1 hypothetical protein [Salmonella enterica subsp. enterica serovar Saintpaul]ECW0844044.1 hypothetical protein [Salmonella enterica subsp. enterica]EDD9544624.1 hypothetical protein [Salmonella enterica subsp. enterica serovar Rissen]HEC7292072.1 hypothetical protein [Salmonella enterica subsp. enterica serovar Pensacola]